MLYKLLAVAGLSLAGSVAFVGPAAPVRQTAVPAYHLLQTMPVGGTGGWDYLTVDAAAHRLYASHGTQVEVLDLQTHQRVGSVLNTPGVHGIAPVPQLGRGYITCGRTNTVSIFDLSTLEVTGTLPTGAKPDAVLFDAYSGRVFVFNNEGATATVINPATNTVVGRVALGGAPEAAVTDGQGLIFVNLEDKNEVVGFDAKTLVVRHRWSVAPGEEPTGLALDRAHHRLFSGCGNGQAVVLDSRTGKVVAHLPIGRGVDGMVFDEASQAAVSSNGADGTLTVLHEQTPDQFRAETVASERGARTIALDPGTHRLYSATAQLGPAPAPTAEVPRPRPTIVSDSFHVLEFGL